jgi:hypothetical protein
MKKAVHIIYRMTSMILGVGEWIADLGVAGFSRCFGA